jgi:hypothetical protein
MKEHLAEFLKKLNKEDIKSIYVPTSKEKSTFSIPIVLEEEEIIEDENGNETKNIVKVNAVLNGEIDRTCYVVYAKYEYHAWITLGGNSYVVDVISAKMDSGNGSFNKTVKNTSSLKKLDEVYEYGNACRTGKMTVTARKGNASATVRVKVD